jgi:hypothetical protein
MKLYLTNVSSLPKRPNFTAKYPTANQTKNKYKNARFSPEKNKNSNIKDINIPLFTKVNIFLDCGGISKIRVC